MKRRILRILPWLAALALSLQVAWASAEDFRLTEFWELDELTDAITPEGWEVLQDWGISDWTDENLIAVTPERFLKTVGQAFLRSLRQPMRMLAALTGMALLSLLLSGIQDIQNSPSVQPLFGAVSVLCIAAVLSSPVLGCLHTVSDLVGDVSVFLAAYIPIMAGVLLAAGRTASATAYNTLMFLGCEGAALIIRSAVIPAAGILLALGVTGAVAGNEHLLRLGKTMRRTVSWTLGLVLILFIGMMTLQTSAAAASDTVASKSAKYLLGSLIPVVGSSVPEAVMAARGCLDLIRASVGALGILAVAAIFLLPLLRILAWYCVFCAGSFLCELLDDRALRILMDSFASGFGLLLSALTAFAAVSAACTGLLLATGGGA